MQNLYFQSTTEIAQVMSLEAALINTFTMCTVKGQKFIVMNTQRIGTNSAVPLSSIEHLSCFQLSDQPDLQQKQAAVFSDKPLINQLYTTCSAPNSRKTQLATGR